MNQFSCHFNLPQHTWYNDSLGHIWYNYILYHSYYLPLYFVVFSFVAIVINKTSYTFSMGSLFYKDKLIYWSDLLMMRRVFWKAQVAFPRKYIEWYLFWFWFVSDRSGIRIIYHYSQSDQKTRILKISFWKIQDLFNIPSYV